MPKLFQAFWLRPHLLCAILVALVAAALAPGPDPGMRLLAGWCAGVVVHAVLVVRRATGQSRDAMRREAARLDDSAGVITLFALLASAASLGSVAVLVVGGRVTGSIQGYALALAGTSMLCTWVFMQLVFTVHYAHVYYGVETGPEAEAERGGLDFHGDTEPDFWDFLYFTVTIGAAAATSDTNLVSKRMRRIATAQTVCAYLFNTGILALAVNMAAGMVPR
ncbi:DUF1345 domain-containing protein [Methylobacterium sp. NEAU K]|uniref:DUF1345 domain-containing protein n=1 Tax=Methylobacterium sp. NEAU K TaxID=3064946 RepID=UPI002735FF1A|nr:DUF1345 domain-containing protein [Methylobacterium sp. NEAU K]MDP4003640.1 DUF1345 domain-containing protein [Methylobacterium sp. NEAU K]